MAKDPAFLFYSSDFIIGTSFFSNEQIGKYVKLLCYQHQMGHLNEKDMLSVCGDRDEMIFSKFKKDPKGLYFNSRLEEESNKRSKYTSSRRKNLPNMSDHMDVHDDAHMLHHMENANENEDIKKNKTTEAKITFLEFVVMTQGQYDQLAIKLGKTVLDEYVARLNNYIGSKGKKYKSHYHTILNWHSRDGGTKPSEHKSVDSRDEWERKASKACSYCRGTGAIYAPGSGKYSKCGCVRLMN